MRTLVALGVAAVLAVPAGSAFAAEDTEQIAAEQRRDADDTGRNVRDRDDRTLTPMDQGDSAQDRTITQEIRKAVTERDELSTNAKNIKIITVDGVVTLRGPVKSQEEKTTIVSIAKKAPGAKRVEDQLEVERRP
jgi:hyperosmotically inducible periplasmic protein